MRFTLDEDIPRQREVSCPHHIRNRRRFRRRSPSRWSISRRRPLKRWTRARCNVVTDTVTGVNIRLRDNLFQLAVVIVCALAGALIAYFASNDRALLALGAIGGLVAGLILSGAILAIYRGMQHLRGKHK